MPRVYDVPEPILAWRWWLIADEEYGLLGSWSTNWHWAVMTATCYPACCYRPSKADGLLDDDTIPHVQNRRSGYGCGVHGFKSAEMAVDHRPSAMYTVFGQVLLGGRILQHEHGYRAQKAKLHAICKGYPFAEATWARYGCEFIDWPDSTFAPGRLPVEDSW